VPIFSFLGFPELGHRSISIQVTGGYPAAADPAAGPAASTEFVDAIGLRERQGIGGRGSCLLHSGPGKNRFLAADAPSANYRLL